MREKKTQADLAGHAEWLLQRGLADRHEVGCYCQWVARFLDVSRSRPKEISQGLEKRGGGGEREA